MLDHVYTFADLAAFLGVKTEAIRFYLYTRRGAASAYKSFSIKKKGGGTRTISAPSRGLYQIQRAILDKILTSENIQHRSCVYSYVPGRGPSDMAARHVSRDFVVRVDIEDFFGSITFPRVLGALKAFPLNIPHRWAVVIANLCTFENKLPQGAPTSPAISNLICRRMDGQLIQFAKQHGFRYSRYSDDIVFSGKTRRKLGLLVERDPATYWYVSSAPLREIAEGNHFRLNEAKTRLTFRIHKQMVVGAVCNKKVNVDRRYVRQIRTLIHLAKQSPDECLDAYKKWTGKSDCSDISSVIKGKIEHIRVTKGSNDSVFINLAESFNSSFAGIRPIGIARVPNKIKNQFDERHVLAMRSYHKWYGHPDHKGTNFGTLFKTGSCFFLDGIGLVTAFHNLLHRNEVIPVNNPAFPPFDVDKAVYCNPEWDIAVLDGADIFKTCYRPLRPERIIPPSPGTRVCVLGYPHFTLGDRLSRKHGTIIQEKERFGMQLFALDIELKEGESGGPVVNERGRVIGIVRSRHSDHFLVPISYIMDGMRGSWPPSAIGDFEEKFTDFGPEEKPPENKKAWMVRWRERFVSWMPK